MAAAPVIESEGRAFPLEYRYLGRDSNERIEDAVARAIRHALREHDGDILAFLPREAEIERTAYRLDGHPSNSLHPLHTALSPPDQQAPIPSSPAPQDRKSHASGKRVSLLLLVTSLIISK